MDILRLLAGAAAQPGGRPVGFSGPFRPGWDTLLSAPSKPSARMNGGTP